MFNHCPGGFTLYAKQQHRVCLKEAATDGHRLAHRPDPDKQDETEGKQFCSSFPAEGQEY